MADTIRVTGNARRPDNTPWAGAKTVFILSATYTADNSQFPKSSTYVNASADGSWYKDLWRNNLGEVGSMYTIVEPDGTVSTVAITEDMPDEITLTELKEEGAVVGSDQFLVMQNYLQSFLDSIVSTIYGPNDAIPEPPAIGALKLVFDPLPPDAATNLQVVPGIGTLLATIDDPPPGEFTRIEWRLVNLEDGLVEVDWVSTGTTALKSFTGLVEHATYRVDVRVANETVLSDTVSATTDTLGTPDVTPPATPTNLALQVSGNDNILTWTDPPDSDLALIEILAFDVVIDEVVAGVQTYTYEDLLDPNIMSWKVRAKDTSGNVSASSSAVGGTQPTGSNVIATGSATTATTATSISIAKPAGVQPGHFMLVFVTVADTSGSNTFTAPSGWTLVTQLSVQGSTNTRTAVYYKFATTNLDQTYQWTWGSAGGASAVIMVLRNINVSTPIDASATQSNSTNTTSAVAPSVTAVASNDVLLAAWAIVLSSVVTAPAPMDHVTSAQTQAGGDRGTVVAAQILSAAGATGTRTATLGTARRSIGVSILAKPAS